MSIYLDKLNTKLKAIQDKNLDSIIAKKTYIPTLGDKYTKEQLKVWLDKRSDFLITARDGGESALNTEKDIAYNHLSNEEKVKADKILNGESDYEFKDDTEWESCIPIILYKFITTP